MSFVRIPIAEAAVAETVVKMDESDESLSHAHGREGEDERLEREHFVNVVQAFLAYRSCSLAKLEKRINDFSTIPLWHRKMVPDYAKRLKESKSCIDENQRLLRSIVSFADGMFRNADFGTSGQTNLMLSLSDMKDDRWE